MLTGALPDGLAVTDGKITGTVADTAKAGAYTVGIAKLYPDAAVGRLYRNSATGGFGLGNTAAFTVTVTENGANAFASVGVEGMGENRLHRQCGLLRLRPERRHGVLLHGVQRRCRRRGQRQGVQGPEGPGARRATKATPARQRRHSRNHRRLPDRLAGGLCRGDGCSAHAQGEKKERAVKISGGRRYIGRFRRPQAQSCGCAGHLPKGGSF